MPILDELKAIRQDAYKHVVHIQTQLENLQKQLILRTERYQQAVKAVQDAERQNG